MEPLLTFVIALGGIATGIGAIWTALVTRHLARASERSVAEQGQIFREQNDRARLSLELDLTYKLLERWNSPLYSNYRVRSLMYVKENYFVGDGISEVDRLDPATERMFNFYEDIGYLTRIGVLQIERVWSEYGGLLYVWSLWGPAVKKAREEWKEPELYDDMEYLYRRIIDLERQRSIGSERPTKEELRSWVEQALLHEEVGREITTGSEDPTKG